MTKTDFPYSGTQAAKMLAEAIHRRQLEGISLRRSAADLGYKQPVVLSHFSSGRTPIPVDRAPQFAAILGIDHHKFITAVLQQRFPDIAWEKHMLGSSNASTSELAQTLAIIASPDLDTLTTQQQRVIREVVADPNADRRWLSVHEVPVIALLRRIAPNLQKDGLPLSDMHAIEALLDPKRSVE